MESAQAQVTGQLATAVAQEAAAQASAATAAVAAAQKAAVPPSRRQRANLHLFECRTDPDAYAGAGRNCGRRRRNGSGPQPILAVRGAG